MVNQIRQKRQARPIKKSPKKVIKKKAKSGPKGPAVRSSSKKRKSPKKTIKKKGAKKKRSKKTGGSGARQNINSEAYNKCWCVDLAVQKALKTCVEDLLKQN